ncbi:MAG: hypothetical protein Fur0025_13200 [Oscillatoriaceae cyanobacterium]
MMIQLENLTVDNSIKYPIADALTGAYDPVMREERDLINQSKMQGLRISEVSVAAAQLLANRSKNTIPCCLDDRGIVIAAGLLPGINLAEVQFEAKRITYRVKPMEQDIKDEPTILRSIIEASPDPIFVKDSEHRWILVNNAFCEFLGKTRDELINQTDHTLFSAQEADIFWKKDESVSATGTPNKNQEYFTDAQGNIHIISTNKFMVTYEKGNQFLVGTIRDITDKVRAEEELKKAKNAIAP